MENKKEEQVEEVVGKATYRELPGLLFSKIGTTDVFDVDHYLKELGESGEGLDVETYLKEHYKQVELVCEVTKTEKKHVVLKLDGESTKMIAPLALDFVCWATPSLLFYAYERLHEIFVNGFSVSDAYLSEAAKVRLPQQGQVPQQQ